MIHTSINAFLTTDDKAREPQGAQRLSIMDSSLVSEIQHGTKAEICRELWGEQPKRQKDATRMRPYWQYFHRKCAEALGDQGRHVALRTYRDVVEVSHQLKADIPRNTIQDAMRSKLTTIHTNEEELLENSVNLATSLLVMIDCGSIALVFSGNTEISWVDGSIREYLKDYLSGAPVLSHSGVKLQKNFTARNLCRIAGIDIIWTDNLVDHLRLTEDDSKVRIFHHASFLEYQSQRLGTTRHRSPEGS